MLILCPNAETPDEMEGVLLGAQSYARATKYQSVVVGIGFTADYPDHAQLARVMISDRDDFSGLSTAAETWLR